MARFFINSKDIQEDRISIGGNEAHHLGTVLRLRIHDAVTLFDQDGTLYEGIIVEKDKKRVQIQIIEKKLFVPDSAQSVLLGQAVPKGKKIDTIVQKATELGATSILPFYSIRSIPRFNKKKAEEKIRHWQKICVEAGKQSGRLPIPTVEMIQDFNDLVQRNFEGHFKIIFWEEEKERQLKFVLKQNSSRKPIFFLVGPEGGFTKREVEFAEQNGFIPTGLGRSIMRTETVSIAMLAIFQYEAGAFG